MSGGGAIVGAEQPTRSGTLRAGASWRRRAAMGLLSVGLLVAVLLVAVRNVRENFHPVAHGRAYRGGQFLPGALKDRLALHHIRSVVNLRGRNPGQAWYQREHAVAKEAGLPVYDIALSSACAPTSGELRELVRIYTTCRKPVLIHCESGLDRTGLGAAIYLLCEEDTTIERAEQQMGLRYGMPPWRERTQRHIAFIGLYRSWLAERSLAHSRKHFFYWATHVYVRPEYLGGPDWPTANVPR